VNKEVQKISKIQAATQIHTKTGFITIGATQPSSENEANTFTTNQQSHIIVAVRFFSHASLPCKNALFNLDAITCLRT
jgi:hypothetical protein